MQPFLIARAHVHNPYEIDMVSVKKLVTEIAEYKAFNSWEILGAFLWQHMSRFMIHKLNMVLDRPEKGNSSNSVPRKYAYRASTLMNLDSGRHELARAVYTDLIELKLENDLNAMTLEWLKQSGQSESNQNQSKDVNLELVNREDKDLVYQQSHEVKSPVKGLFRSSPASVSSPREDTNCANVTLFRKPREVYKRNGELLEAFCLNSINQQEAALASNKKDSSLTSPFDFIIVYDRWLATKWVGRFRIHPGSNVFLLGVGGATVGVGSMARPRKDLIGSGAFGVPGYAGIGATGFGREIQQGFEDFVDPPATVDNITTMALSSHPLRPFFLVGSSNTHIYLWEFNKYRATATYGVLPAVNVPPPYALASISALRFDHWGHRFASAALDGTVCTWRLEVGGRSNVRPTESSLCFDGHASDITYFSSSGSIIAVAGYSSMVLMCMKIGLCLFMVLSLIFPSSSAFDNDVGSGSISPIIVTGGKGGDVGVRDFRYIATGKAKRHRRTDYGEQSSSPSLNSDKDHNVNGMLWHIPRAHSGKTSLYPDSSIPNTSLFLTGSKDGDVKSTKLVLRAYSFSRGFYSWWRWNCKISTAESSPSWA
ncbi:hypothetical protein L6164_021244 [Bauhinia variegata]|uniref:Uncharacterized protein n=1 Tax=Bauhinia variegata TaxID=167791 RepID=A0ACB9MZ29_BAUVA|nr:hypothetical protein L6164_021244 [Bauhinia variegata]